MTRFLCMATALFMLAEGAVAQEVIGTVTGTLDGEERTWFMTAQDGTSQSDWTGGGHYVTVSILAHPEPDTVMQSRDAVMISFDLMGAGEARNVSSAEIVWMVGGMTDAYVADDETGALVEIDSMMIEEEALRISGSFAGELGRSSNFGRTRDPDDTRTIEGRFEGELQKL